MLERRPIRNEQIIACLRAAYGLPVAELAFLPLGADVNTAVYRVVTGDGKPYFLKLRRGPFDEVSVALPHFLSNQGIPQILAPLSCSTGELWAQMDGFRTIVYPFVEGRNGYAADLSDRQTVPDGAFLPGHTIDLAYRALAHDPQNGGSASQQARR